MPKLKLRGVRTIRAFTDIKRSDFSVGLYKPHDDFNGELMKTRIGLKKADVVLVAVLTLVAAAWWAAFFFVLDTGNYAVVYVDGEVWGRYRLDEDAEVKIPVGEGYNVLVIRGGEADVTDADCPDRTCVHSRPIGKVGQTIVCLPHKLTVKIVGDGESDVDVKLQ